MPKVPEETKGIFKFLKPSDIAIIGSYMFDAVISPNITVDIMIEMPAKMFQKQDYQNYRYMKKKAIYLAFIAFNITDDIAKSKTFMNDSLRPFLKIVPSGKLGTKMNVFIYISAQEGSFKLSRFLPEKNNVRSEWFFNEEKSSMFFCFFFLYYIYIYSIFYIIFILYIIYMLFLYDSYRRFTSNTIL